MVGNFAAIFHLISSMPSKPDLQVEFSVQRNKERNYMKLKAW